VAALAFPVFIAAIVRSPLFAERRTIALRQFVLCLAFPIVAFEAWKLSMLGGNAAAWSRLVFAEVADVVGPNAALSGSATLTEALLRPAAVLTNLRTHAPIAAAWFGGSRDPLLAPIWWKGWAPGAALLLSVGLALRNVSRSTCADVPAAVVVSSRILLGVGAVSLAWWLTLAPMGWVRHLLPGLLCGLIGLALLLAVCARTRPRTTALAAALLLVALAPNLVSVAHPFASVSELRSDLRTGLHPVPRLAALLRTADYLHRIEAADSGLRLVGCGWSHNPSLEYLMPGSDHFRDCILVRGRELNGRRLVLVRGEYFNQARSPEIERFQRWCEEHVLFQALHFVVSECSGPPPEAPWY
jgi:hypothetical protein